MVQLKSRYLYFIGSFTAYMTDKNIKSLHKFFILKITFLYLGFTAHQDNFTHFEPSHSLDGAKTGDQGEKTPDRPQTELGSSHT